jgi:hypothetical protein
MSDRRAIALVVHGHRAGNAKSDNSLISAECLARVSVAEQVAANHGVTDVLFSGSGMPGFPSEARQMADLWSGPSVRLWLDEPSTDSAENSAAGLRWAHELGAAQLIVVSSWWHLRLFIYYRDARALGIRVQHLGCKRMDGFAGHLLHELRYLPRALRHRSSRSAQAAAAQAQRVAGA